MEEPGRLLHGVAMSRTRLSDFTFTFHFHALEKEMATHSSVLGLPPLGQGGWREVIPKLLATLLWEYNFTTWHLGG